MTEEKMKKQRRNAVVRQARSSETHQRESHAGVRESRPCLIKDAAAITWQNGQAGGGRALLDLKDVLHILSSEKNKGEKRQTDGRVERRTKGTRLLS
jgi:hypothetical protein